MEKKLEIVLDEYNYKCGDGCCDHYGTTTTINGEELQNHNQDAGSILEQVLIHLGYEVTIKETYNGK
jgi:hypothetical protein